MNPVSAGCCIEEAQDLAEAGRACQPQRSRRREGRVQQSRDNVSGAGDTQASSNRAEAIYPLPMSTPTGGCRGEGMGCG